MGKFTVKDDDPELAAMRSFPTIHSMEEIVSTDIMLGPSKRKPALDEHEDPIPGNHVITFRSILGYAAFNQKNTKV